MRLGHDVWQLRASGQAQTIAPSYTSDARAIPKVSLEKGTKLEMMHVASIQQLVAISDHAAFALSRGIRFLTLDWPHARSSIFKGYLCFCIQNSIVSLDIKSTAND